MRSDFFFFLLLAPLLIFLFHLQAHAAPSGPLVKHLTSLVKWTRSSTKIPNLSDGNVVQFEQGYLVETVVEGNELGVVPYSVRLSLDGDLYAVDAVNSNIVRVTPPLSHYSRARLVAGSFQGHTGHVDGKPSDARFNHPKGVTVDDKGNVYVADLSNFAIRKIGEAGVTTIAGGNSNVAGFRDGPSEGAKFSSDFDLMYVRSTCSLLVIDRGNAALRQISLNREDCDYADSSISVTDLVMVAGAIFIGYVTCKLQQGFGSTFFSKMQEHSGTKLEKQTMMKDTPTLVDATITDEQEAGWPSFGQLLWDLSNFCVEMIGGMLMQIIPSRSKAKSSNGGLTPLKDSLIMPGDEVQPLSKKHTAGLTPLKDSLIMPEDEVQSSSRKQTAPAPASEIRRANAPTPIERFTEVKPAKIRSSSSKDPSLSSKHRSSRRQEYAEYYGSGEVSQQVRSKSQKDRTKHRQREKSGEVAFVASVPEQKHAEVKPTSYENSKYDPYNFKNKYRDSYRYD